MRAAILLAVIAALSAWPALALSATHEEQFTISIVDVNDAPVAVADAYGNAVGNTQAVLGTTGSGPVSGAGSESQEDRVSLMHRSSRAHWSNYRDQRPGRSTIRSFPVRFGLVAARARTERHPKRSDGQQSLERGV